MTTLIAVYNSDGCVGRCDARCYNAKGPDCDCICGGMNHGKGLKQGIQNAEERWPLERVAELPLAANFQIPLLLNVEVRND